MAVRRFLRRHLSGPPPRAWPGTGVYHGARWLLLLSLAVMLAVVFPSGAVVRLGTYEAGTVATDEVNALFAFDVPKSDSVLRIERAAAMAAVVPTFRFREEAWSRTTDRLGAFFARADSAFEVAGAAGVTALLIAEGIPADSGQIAVLADAEAASALQAAAQAAAARLVGQGVTDPAAASELESDSIRIVTGGAARVVPRSDVLSAREFHDAALAGREAGPASDLLRQVLARYLAPSLVPDTELNAAARREARESVRVTAGRVLEGQVIVRAGDPVGEAELARIEAYRNNLRAAGYTVGQASLGGAVGGFALNTVVLSIFGVLLFFYRPDIYREYRHLLAVALAAAIYFGAAFFVARLEFPGPALPTVFVTVLLAILWDGRLALVAVMVITALTAAQDPFASPDTVLLALAGGSAAALSVRNFQRLSQTWHFIAITYGVYLVVLGALSLRGADFALLPALGWALAATVASAIMAIGFLPVFELLTGITTTQTLVTWADPNRPLMQRLALEAPGTNTHTLQVANLAEAAARDVGANPVLCRAGAYYHDVGKLTSPLHFIENQPDNANPHDHMDPLDSAVVVRRHVTGGVELAEREKVPAAVVEFIREHHGDQEIGFFLDRAVERAENEGGEPPDPADFRYPGPRPQSRETAIVMLADTVESAMRTFKNPTPERIRAKIQALFTEKLGDGQLDDANLTLRDLARMKERFARVLGGIHHRRIEYPERRAP